MRYGRSLLLSFLSLSVLAQPALQTETIEVRLVEVDAVVTDAAGRHVVGLGPADFELFENGRPQQITNFSEVTEARPEAASVVSPAQRRTIVILIDTLGIAGPERAKFFGELRSLTERVV